MLSIRFAMALLILNSAQTNLKALYEKGFIYTIIDANVIYMYCFGAYKGLEGS